MTERDREWMESYIYQVIRRLPKSQREETAMELRELISDMAEQNGQSVEEVLKKLGNPAVFARQYQDGGSCLIGPEYYEDYLWILKIVMICVALSAVVSALVQGFVERSFFVTVFSDMLGNGITSCLGAFGAVTLIFAILERQHVKVELRSQQEWSVKDLEKDISKNPQVVLSMRQTGPKPDKKAVISRAESAVGVVFMALFCGIFVFAPYLIGAYVFKGDEFVCTIPILNLDEWGRILPFLILSLMVGFIDEIIRLVTGCYCKLVMVSNLVCGVLQVGFSVYILRFLPVWNPEFLPEIEEAFEIKLSSKWDMLSYYGTDLFSNILIGIIIFATMLEIANTVYKTLRYGMK